MSWGGGWWVEGGEWRVEGGGWWWVVGLRSGGGARG